MPEIKPRAQQIPSGEGVQFVPPEFGLAVTAYGSEPLMRRMMRDGWLYFAFAMVCALVVEGEHRVVSAIGDLPQDADLIQRREKRIADEIADYHRRWIADLRRPLRRTLWYAMEALPYGHKLAEIEWSLAENREDAGRLVPVDVAPKPRTGYELIVDNSNRLTSVRPLGAKSDGSGDVPPTSVFVFSLAGRDDHPAGTPALERVYEPWWSKNCAKPNERKGIAAFGGGVAWAEADKDVPGTIEVIDPTTKETSVRFAATVVAEEASKIKVGQFGAMLPGWRLKQMPPATSFGAFDSTYNRANQEMLAAFFVAARSLMEAQFGSRADSETAEGMLSSIRDWLRGELCEAVRSQLLMVGTIANFGKEAKRFCPDYAIVTEERSELGAVTTALQTFSTAGVLTPELADHLLAQVGVPESVRRSVMAAISAGVQTSAPDTEFAAATKPEGKKVEKAAAKADRDTGKLVSRYDRQLRKTTARWLDGKLDSDAFLQRFTEQLTTGHEEAATLGARLAGFEGERLPVAVREYVAATLGTEGEFLQDLVDQVADETRTPAQARLAARRYAQRMGGTVSAAFHEASPRDSQFFWELGEAEHCRDCPRLQDMSPWLKDELITRPREGETECQGGCKCRLVRADGACGPGPVTLGDYD
ncbi:MAG: phage portal protein family protein [Fimbriimonas sp.]